MDASTSGGQGSSGLTTTTGGGNNNNNNNNNAGDTTMTTTGSLPTWIPFSLRRSIYRVVSYPTLADKIPFFVLQAIVSNGKWAFPILLGVCAAFALLWLPFWLLSFLITEFGVYAILIGTVFFIGRVIIRLLAFPGSSFKVSGDIEAEFAKYSVRMLDAAVTCVMDLSTSVLSLSSTANQGSGGGGMSSTNYDVVTLWKRTKSYRDRVLGLYFDVLSYVYQDDASSTPDGGSASHATMPHLTRHGNNRLNGDVGNLANVTTQAQSDGRTLLTLLGRLLAGIRGLERHASSVLEGRTNSGESATMIPSEVRTIARNLLETAKELHDILPSFKPNVPDNSLLDDLELQSEDDTADVTIDSVRAKLEQEENAGGTYAAAKGAASSILPLLDPPPHTSVFGMDVLRGTMLSRYAHAQQFWVRRPKGAGQLDVVHIPATNWSPTTMGRNPKAVLYCNPNAGLLEVAVGMSLNGGNISSENNEEVKENCWTDYYTHRGYDVYLFNYAGFGRSSGTSRNVQNKARSSGCFAACAHIFYSAFLDFQPTPSSLRADAISVGSFIVTDLGVTQLVVHGESIGGMAAAGAARHLSSNPLTQERMSLLICDRTFSNLEATAQRLVGAWSGRAIRTLAPIWSTDVAKDFLATTCPKVVANDAADSIIADPASLRGGISQYQEIRREVSTKGVGWVMDTPWEYRMAEFENVCVQQHFRSMMVQQAPVWPADKYMSLQECFHFAACARRIGKLATMERRSNNGGLRSRTASSDGEGGGFSFAMSPKSDGGGASGLSKVWRSMSCCDGLVCGHLGSYVRQGNDWTVMWLCSALTYGGQVLVHVAENRMQQAAVGGQQQQQVTIEQADFDLRPIGYESEESDTVMHPKPIPEVLAVIKAALESNSGDPSLAPIQHELQFCGGVLEYMVGRLTAPPVIETARKALHFQHPTLGCFLNLHCGHNNQYSPEEKERLQSILQEVAR
mmetsp:Transcript_31650/g.46946  ORF Transcript_31650/g.46946 Transcript_31650/m.46946 type:complete len:965 (-) Transcript_31650:147-3041(-)